LRVSRDASTAVTIQAAHSTNPHIPTARVFNHAHDHPVTETFFGANLPELALLTYSDSLVRPDPKVSISGRQHTMHFVRRYSFLQTEALEALDHWYEILRTL
jgi:hypothetical protein